MAKTFGSLKIGDIVYLKKFRSLSYRRENFYHYLSEDYAVVTYIETIGDDVVVSYKNPHLNHTVRASKKDDKAFHYGPIRQLSRKWRITDDNSWCWAYYVKAEK